MPFPTASTFPPLVREFSTHWKVLNATLRPAGPLLVLESLPVAALEVLGERLDEVETGHGPRSVELRLSQEAVRAAVGVLRARTRDFNLWMRANYPKLPEARVLAAVVAPGEALDGVWKMARVTLRLWQRMVARPPERHAGPPVLRGGWTRADYEAALEVLEAAVAARIDAEGEERLALAEAVVLREEIVAVVTAYAHAVRGRLREGAAQRASLPVIWHRGGRVPRKRRVRPPVGEGH